MSRSESQVVKSSSSSSSYSHSSPCWPRPEICLFIHSHCVAKGNGLRANALWPLSSPKTKPVRVGILRQPFPPSSFLLFLSLEIFGAAVSFVPPPHVSLPFSRLPATLLPFRGTLCPARHPARLFPSIPFRSCAFTTCQSFEQN